MGAHGATGSHVDGNAIATGNFIMRQQMYGEGEQRTPSAVGEGDETAWHWACVNSCIPQYNISLAGSTPDV